MTEECFIRYFKLQFYLYKFPVRIYREGELANTFDPAPIRSEKIKDILSHALRRHLMLSAHHVQIYQSPHYFCYLTVKDKACGLAAVIGPVRTIPLDEKAISEIAAANGTAYSEMQEYLDTLPFIPLGLLAIVLSSYSIAVNGIAVSDSELYDNIMNLEKDAKMESAILKHEENVVYEEEMPFNGAVSESKLLYFMQNGMLDELKSFWKQIFPERLLTQHFGSLREMKDHCLLSLGIIAHASMNSGIPADTNFNLRSIYTRKIESCTSAREVIDMRYTILCDFTERNSQTKYQISNDPFIGRAMRYVTEHIDRPVSLAEVCDRLNVNKSYFCTKFKETMGMGFSDFIHQEKIKKAKQLLLYTDKPLVEIANFLSFSSQGYFQSIFKKVTGMTPAQFRKSGGKI